MLIIVFLSIPRVRRSAKFCFNSLCVLPERKSRTSLMEGWSVLFLKNCLVQGTGRFLTVTLNDSEGIAEVKPSWEDGQELVFNWTANKPSRKTPFFPLHTCPLSFCSAIPSHHALHSVPSVRQWPAQTLGSVCSGSSISSSPFRVMPGGPCSGMGFAIFLLIFSFSAGAFCPF